VAACPKVANLTAPSGKGAIALGALLMVLSAAQANAGGCYLLDPPVREETSKPNMFTTCRTTVVDDAAPFSKWEMVNVYDSCDKCKREAQFQIALRTSPIMKLKDPYCREVPFVRYTLTKPMVIPHDPVFFHPLCVATDDPRLKEP